MDSETLLDLFDRELRRDLSFHAAGREVTPFVIRNVPIAPGQRWGWIIYSRLTGQDVDAIIEEQIAFYGERGLNFEWKWYGHDDPPDLPDRLLAHGFEMEELESVMVLDLHAAPDSLWAPDDAGIRRITEREGVLDAVAVEDAVWGTPHDWLVDEVLPELEQRPEQLSMYCVYADGRPVAAAWARFHSGTQFASLWGGSTIAERRRRGLYSALLAVRAREARERGYRYLTVDASEMSRPILEKHGFTRITTTRPFNWSVDQH